MNRRSLKQRLAAGEIIFGAATHVAAPALVEVLGYSGFDFAMIDLEHGLFGIETAAELIRTAQGVGLHPLVRVHRNEPESIMKVLDLGAEGVIVPHIAGREDALRAVAACRYGSHGKRGACPLVRANRYGLGEWAQFEKQANEDIMAIALIEDLSGADQIDVILSVDGLDAVFLGPFDMSVSCDCHGHTDDPKVQQAVDRVLAACKARGVPAMFALTKGGDIDALVKKGVRMIMQSAENVVFARACKAFLASVAHLRKDDKGETL